MRLRSWLEFTTQWWSRREKIRRFDAWRSLAVFLTEARSLAEDAFDARVANAATACLHAWRDRTATLKRARALVRDACERWRIDRSRDAFGTWRHGETASHTTPFAM